MNATVIATAKGFNPTVIAEVLDDLSPEDKDKLKAYNGMGPDERLLYQMRETLGKIVAIKGVQIARRVLHRELFQFQVEIQGADRHAIAVIEAEILSISLISVVETYTHDPEFIARPSVPKDLWSPDQNRLYMDAVNLVFTPSTKEVNGKIESALKALSFIDSTSVQVQFAQEFSEGILFPVRLTTNITPNILFEDLRSVLRSYGIHISLQTTYSSSMLIEVIN